MSIGHRLHGQGAQRVIVLHDWQGDHRNYDLALPFFDTQACTYALADLRGYGWSRDIAGAHTAAEAAGDVIALADELGWDRFHLVGHSMTGMVVQRVAIDAGARVGSVVAANPVPASGMKMAEADLDFFRATIEDDEAFGQLLAAISNRELGRAWIAYKRQLCRDAADGAARADYLRMFNGTDIAAEAVGITTPMLVLLGECDHESLGEAAMQRTFGAWYPNARLEVIRDAGHYPMQEMPPYFAAVIDAFIQQHAG